MDFKKKDGYARSIELSRTLGLYRQAFCGCEFSLAASSRGKDAER
jgi:predicted adenine nucleotide alpha hydrolase (AANH) superfamily ATPase